MPGGDLVPVRFDDLAGFAADDHLGAFRIFAATAAASLKGQKPLRAAKTADAALAAVFGAALVAEVADDAAARDFFVAHFAPYRIRPANGGRGFVTGYYEPVVPGSLVETEQFTTPILARPDDLDRCQPYPERAAIEAGAIAGHTRPLVWVEDPVEAFLIHVQGSARVILPDGEEIRLVYVGRNGQPYTSVGRLLIESGAIAPEAMSLAVLKACVRAQGQKPGEPGRNLLQQNKSYIFFELARGISSEFRPHWRCRPAARGSARDCGRSYALVIWTAVLAQRGTALAIGRTFAVPALDDRAGHGLGDNRRGAGGYFFRLGRSRGNPRGSHPPCLRLRRPAAAEPARA